MNNVKVKLKDIVTVKNGSTPSTSNPNYYDGEIIWITPKDLSNQNSRYVWKCERTITNDGLSSCSSTLLPKGTVLMSSRAPIGLLSIAATELCTNQGFKNFIPNTNVINSEFLYYYLKTKIHDIEKLGSGTTFKEVSKSSIENFELTIPKDINDQYKISNILSILDSKIELNNRINAELEAMAKTIYDYWFVQFDFPNEDGKPYKSSGGKMVWDEKLKREIPEGWLSAELKDIANITMGQSPPGESYNENGEGFVFYQGCTDFGSRFPSIRQYTTQPSRFAKPGDILLSVRAPVGAINISMTECCIGRGLAALSSKDNCTPFLFEVLRNLKQVFDRRNSDGTTFGAITKDDLFSLKVVIPKKEVVNEFSLIFQPVFEKQNIIALENEKLAGLRDWLLPMLMNGQVKVN